MFLYVFYNLYALTIFFSIFFRQPFLFGWALGAAHFEVEGRFRKTVFVVQYLRILR